MGARFSAVILVAAILLSGNWVRADELTLEFNIQPQREGSSPWDSLGFHSGQIDTPGDVVDGLFAVPGAGSIFEFGAQVGVDRANEEIGPPDPYVCFLTEDRLDLLGCMLRQREAPQSNMLRHRVKVPEWVLRNAWFGVVLIDADRPDWNHDDLIGYGVVLDEPTLAGVRSGDPGARRLAGRALALVKAAVSSAGQAGSGAVSLQRTKRHTEPARLARSKCEEGCPVGNADVRFRITTDGW